MAAGDTRRGRADLPKDAIRSMTATPPTTLDALLHNLPCTYAGPGGALAVLREGEVVVRHSWGWANAERRIPFTPQTLFRVCSITKQFTCALVLDAFPDPSVLDAEVRARLPVLAQAPPTTLHLCHNQSGLRDYWALAMLQGAPVESAFGAREAAQLIASTRTLQFDPGTRYSYANQNFRLLSEIIEARTSRSFGALLRGRLFDPAGMDTAFLAADTRAMPDGTEGYEGTPATGFRPAVNNILWTGDAGLGASLDDMIAWERFIDRTCGDADGLYGRLAAPVRFADGALASYGFGLARSTHYGREVIGHGGALRGWRSQRLHVASERLSVVVLFNHLSDAHAAALDVLAAALGQEPPRPDPAATAPGWIGTYLEPETELAVRIEAAPAGRVRLRYAAIPEMLDLSEDGTAGHDATRLRAADAGFCMDRPQENQSTRLLPRAAAGRADIAGRYRCDELDAVLTVVDTQGVLYGGFSGILGDGRMELLDPVAEDLWALPCPRALDHTPPGDWTLAFARNAEGGIARVTVGCWLARRLSYVPAP